MKQIMLIPKIGQTLLHTKQSFESGLLKETLNKVNKKVARNKNSKSVIVFGTEIWIRESVEQSGHRAGL